MRVGRKRAVRAGLYRRRLAREFPIGLNEDIDLNPAIADRILQFVAEKTGTAFQLDTLGQGPPDENGAPTYNAIPVAGQGPPIYIFFAGTHFSPAWPK